MTTARESPLDSRDSFERRHIGPDAADVQQMLAELGYPSLAALIDDTIPAGIRMDRRLDLPPPRSEHEALEDLRMLAAQNRVFRSFIGLGYHDCITPPVIQRNVLENPGWYTQYTPYQPEISQGRLEALVNFQTMIVDLTGLPLANASLLDEATAAAEAMHMCLAAAGPGRRRFMVADDCHPQTIAVVKTRARPLGVEVEVGRVEALDYQRPGLCGLLLQYPGTDGRVRDNAEWVRRAQQAGGLVVMAADPLALVLLRPPGELGADICVGSAQRLGVGLGYGGPHAGFLATREEHKRQMPGRLVGVSRDVHGAPAFRLALQTREQHIRRDRATSNICTAQVLPAVLASMYAVYHGPEGLQRIAWGVHMRAVVLAVGLRRLGHDLGQQPFFDTLTVRLDRALGDKYLARAQKRGINLRAYPDGPIGISLDETVSLADLEALLDVFAEDGGPRASLDELAAVAGTCIPAWLLRTSELLTHPVFGAHHSETEMLRYLKRLEARDLSLTTSMIPLGSCTMKLNAAAEMLPITWRELQRLHPFVPADQAVGYRRLIEQLEAWLCEITGFVAASLQPNSGAQGEYTGLLAIRAYHESRGEPGRDVCLIPVSAHGTNPASAVLAGFRVVPVRCDVLGNVDLADLAERAQEHRAELAALMITYPSTHGVFEEKITRICEIVHEQGGQVYMDGANMNAQVGLCRPADIGADVCHLNLHKTFCIPHGGGGPGMGPICVAAHLAPFLPGHPLLEGAEAGPVGAVSAAPYGSPSVLPIPWMYIAMMGEAGLRRASEVAILNANYMARRLEGHYKVLYTGRSGRVAHEFILDLRPFKAAGVEAEDVAKRLMDYGFHAPTMSWPVAGTLMIEPTESEPRGELDRFCDALVAIREEIRAIEEGRADRADNPLKNAPHTAAAVTAEAWTHPYGRQQAAYPAPWLREHKVWPSVGRIDNAYGDRNLFCTCPPVTDGERH
jgi:glycine dehydrogenase